MENNMISVRRDVSQLKLEDFIFTGPAKPFYISSANDAYNLIIGKTSDGENTLSYEILAAGYEESNFEIRQEKSKLIIKAKRKQEEENVKYYTRSFRVNDFNLSIGLLEYYVVSEANYVNGILTIKTIEKLPDFAKPKVFKVNEPQLLLE
jgi:hypothetical protein